MLNRDFTKSNKEYIKKNKYVLCALFAFLVIGLVIACVFGFNGNFEMKKYNEFSVNVGVVSTKTGNSYREDIKNIVNNYGGDVDTISVLDEGDLTKYVVRYSTHLSEEEQISINAEIAQELEIEIIKISEHVQVNPVVKASDYIYTAAAILIILVIATIFAFIRYNGASAIAIIMACLLGSAGFLSISAILRLSIGLSYFAMIVILNVLIIYSAINIFERIRESGFIENKDYSSAIKTAMIKSRKQLTVISVAVMTIGVLFVLLAPTPARLVSLNIMFMSVVLLAVSCYVIPFVWSMLITYCNKRKVKKEQK